MVAWRMPSTGPVSSSHEFRIVHDLRLGRITEKFGQHGAHFALGVQRRGSRNTGFYGNLHGGNLRSEAFFFAFAFRQVQPDGGLRIARNRAEIFFQGCGRIQRL